MFVGKNCIKISFWLKKPSDKQSKLLHFIINNPRKIIEGNLVDFYACEIYLPFWEKKTHLIYSTNPVDALCLATEFIKTQLQFLINRDFIISEKKNGEVWKLDKKDPQCFLQEKINELKNNPSITLENKREILKILKESFGNSSSLINEQVNKVIDENN